MSDAEGTVTVNGRSVDLENGGRVFFGACAESPDERYLKLTNPEGEETKLRLSLQAVDAIRQLINDPHSLTESLWRVIAAVADPGLLELALPNEEGR